MKWSILRGVFGLFLVGLLVWLGLQTASVHPSPLIVAIFGIAAAILGPVSIGFMGGAFPSRRDSALEKLAKAGEIEEKVAQADTIDQKVKVLAAERRRLETIIAFEARRQLLLARKEMLEEEGGRLVEQADRILGELIEIDRENKLLGEEVAKSPVEKEIVALRERLQREQTGVGRQSTRWLESVNLYLPIFPFGFPVRGRVARKAIDTALDYLEDQRTRRLGKRAKELAADENAVDSPPGDVKAGPESD